jgi:hypothetical protein
VCFGDPRAAGRRLSTHRGQSHATACTRRREVDHTWAPPRLGQWSPQLPRPAPRASGCTAGRSDRQQGAPGPWNPKRRRPARPRRRRRGLRGCLGCRVRWAGAVRAGSAATAPRRRRVTCQGTRCRIKHHFSNVSTRILETLRVPRASRGAGPEGGLLGVLHLDLGHIGAPDDLGEAREAEVATVRVAAQGPSLPGKTTIENRSTS